MSNQLSVKNYRPPLITEVDEPIREDCTINATLMGVASWTLGEAVSGSDWRPLNKAELKKLREHMRNTLGPKFQHGGTNLIDTAHAVENVFPWLPPMPYFAKPGEDYTFNKMLRALRDNSVVIAQGNPSHVKNEKSGLRRWTNNDDYGHSILLERANDKDIYIMDPMGFGSYDGQWVPIDEVREFLFFTSEHEPYIAILERGGESSVSRATRPLFKTVDAQAKVIATSKTQIGELNSKLTATTTENTDLAGKVMDLTAKVTELQAQLDATPTTEPTDCSEVAGERDALQARVNEQDSQISALNKAAEDNGGILAKNKAILDKIKEALDS